MSEYQYYEFLAVDQPLGKEDIAALRSLSTRARITATSFTNHYNWGDFKGDPHVMAEVRNRIQEAQAPTTTEKQERCRTVSTLRARAAEICEERKAAKAAQMEAKRQQRAREAEKARRARLSILRLRGMAVWDEVENEIEKCNINGYERATDLLADLRVLTEENNTSDAYSERVRALRSRHSRKTRLIEQLTRLERI